jgi:hypothetical protein
MPVHRRKKHLVHLGTVEHWMELEHRRAFFTPHVLVTLLDGTDHSCHHQSLRRNSLPYTGPLQAPVREGRPLFV